MTSNLNPPPYYHLAEMQNDFYLLGARIINFIPVARDSKLYIYGFRKYTQHRFEHATACF